MRDRGKGSDTMGNEKRNKKFTIKGRRAGKVRETARPRRGDIYCQCRKKRGKTKCSPESRWTEEKKKNCWGKNELDWEVEPCRYGVKCARTEVNLTGKKENGGGKASIPKTKTA